MGCCCHCFHLWLMPDLISSICFCLSINFTCHYFKNATQTPLLSLSCSPRVTLMLNVLSEPILNTHLTVQTQELNVMLIFQHVDLQSGTCVSARWQHIPTHLSSYFLFLVCNYSPIRPITALVIESRFKCSLCGPDKQFLLSVRVKIYQIYACKDDE